jgi:hypothetical protein
MRCQERNVSYCSPSATPWLNAQGGVIWQTNIRVRITTTRWTGRPNTACCARPALALALPHPPFFLYGLLCAPCPFHTQPTPEHGLLPHTRLSGRILPAVRALPPLPAPPPQYCFLRALLPLSLSLPAIPYIARIRIRMASTRYAEYCLLCAPSHSCTPRPPNTVCAHPTLSRPLPAIPRTARIRIRMTPTRQAAWAGNSYLSARRRGRHGERTPKTAFYALGALPFPRPQTARYLTTSGCARLALCLSALAPPVLTQPAV